MIPAHWREAALTPPTAWGRGPLGTGALRTSPEDFKVTEILGFEPHGSGPHALLTVRKRGANTEWVAPHPAICISACDWRPTPSSSGKDGIST